MKRQDKDTIGLAVARDIRRLIKEYMCTKGKKKLITEYAASRQDISNKIDSKSDAIFSHWALLKYSTLSGKLTNYRDHWRSELLAFMGSISRLKVKPNNNRDIVYKLIEAQWFTIYEYNTDIEALCGAIFPKFMEEGIARKWQDCIPCAQELQKEMEHIARLIAYADENEINEYIKTI